MKAWNEYFKVKIIFLGIRRKLLKVGITKSLPHS